MPLVLDAGCGAGLTARLLIGEGLHRVRYIGADISTAVGVAPEAFRQRGLPGYFIQADLLNFPFAENSFDYILSEGVLHHTPSTRAAIHALARLLKTGGVLAFYVYKRKSPIREFADDFIREHLRSMSPEEAW
ncbi:class I SAM-dependent methyltransferase [Tepidimonas taiwanensis]|uniref:class I SAM-dependent methyltransferase n=1 Tax=Tepidimonas taiwanensis TaxID=307486 RepID=UPI0009DDE50E|nr:class I SAM-dependent methyltransferase [Tepidimonas taiwanensis]